jgi:serine/threonine-protein kinase PknG
MIACQRAGCTGHYAADGYCDECGHKAPAGLAAATPAGGSTGISGLTGVTGSGVSGSGVSGSGVSGVSGTSSSRSHSAGRGRLGANLVSVPPVPLRDPASAVQANPSVPESQRFCGKCGQPVGRGRDGQPGRTEGFCPRDRAPYAFVPALSPGDLVDDRYEILGAIAHGGLGWIYLGRDRNISNAGSDRWVVLKGLINAGDPDAMAAAVAERRFLVEVDHPNIVKIHDFAEHPDPKTGELVGYIVMEYVGGRSLKDLALAHRGPDGGRAPLPLDQVLAYGLEMLPALGYLHGRDLLFCDFKPDNVIHAEEQLKLIDLGAVRRMDDDQSALYGTPGYQAPELATAGPSVGSDLYTVGRTLAVLSFDFQGFSSRYAETLPPRAEVPLLAVEESYYRFLQRATHHEPSHRFESAADMADQLLGVLREVLSAADGIPRPAPSTQFTAERHTFGGDGAPLSGAAVAAALPLPLVDPTDPGAGFLATLSAGDPAATVTALVAVPDRSLEVTLRLVRAYTEVSNLAAAHDELQAVASQAGHDWRIAWYGGVLALASGDDTLARQRFDAVYAALPGEVAPRLALAAACELAGDGPGAAQAYERVWRVDHGYPSAAFGLARILAAHGNRDLAIGILDEVPDSSSQHVAAKVAALRTRLDLTGGTLAEHDLADASTRLEQLKLDTARQAQLSVEMFRTALEWLGTSVLSPTRAAPQRAGSPAVRLLGQGLNERELRLGLERAYRVLATLEPDTRARYALVDQANAVRPRTMV